ncbi:MAG: IS1595 family transposase [Candidatus Binataceae bacterium]
MAKNQGKVAGAKSGIVAALPRACQDEAAAVEFFEAMRWGDSGVCCPHCGNMDVYQMKDRNGNRNARFLWRCKGCNKQFTVRVKSVYEDSPIPLRHWAYGFWAACASKKGVSSKQIQRMTGLSYKSALFMMHRIRFAMAPTADVRKLSGTIEADETYVGGKDKNRHMRDRHHKTGPWDKATVIAMVERGGEIRSHHIPTVNMSNVGEIVRANVKPPESRLMTDDTSVYGTVGPEFAGGHQMVNHRKGEYVRGDVTTNSIESAFSLLKRGLYGTFHSVSRKHLHRYLSEFDFRFNTRKMDDGGRTALAIKKATGKRLTYAKQIGKAA